MKSNSLSAILLGVLAISALASIVLTMMYSTSSREFRQLQGQVAMVQNNRMVANQLVNELLEYSKRNPAIDPVLEATGLKKGSGSVKAAPAK
jgi:hypothetical protein